MQQDNTSSDRFAARMTKLERERVAALEEIIALEDRVARLEAILTSFLRESAMAPREVDRTIAAGAAWQDLETALIAA